jgi:hypothetical protein
MKNNAMSQQQQRHQIQLAPLLIIPPLQQSHELLQLQTPR